MAPTTTQSVLERARVGVQEAVSTLRNVDGSVKGRIHFDQSPKHKCIKAYMGETISTAVTWEVQGLPPHTEFEFQIRVISYSPQEGLILTPERKYLSLDYFVQSDGESGFSYYAIAAEDGTSTIMRSVIMADGEGSARGISIERGLRIQDILGRLIVLKVREGKGVKLEAQEDGSTKKGGTGRPVFGLIGCRCPLGSNA